MAVTHGSAKACKTWLNLEIAMAVSTGTPAFGEFRAEPGCVAYFFAEDFDKKVQNRVRAGLSGRGLTSAGKLYLRPRGKFIDLTQDDDVAWVIASCRKLGKVDLVILDPMRDVHTAEEDKSGEMHPLMQRARAMGDVIGCTIAFTHHTGHDRGGKSSGFREGRGSTAIRASTDSGLSLTLKNGEPEIREDGSTFELQVKSEVKGGRSAAPFRLTLDITDDDNGEAKHVTWTHIEGLKDPEDKSEPGEEDHVAGRDEEALLALVRANRGMRWSKLRELTGMAPEKAAAVRDRLKDQKRITVRTEKKVVYCDPAEPAEPDGSEDVPF